MKYGRGARRSHPSKVGRRLAATAHPAIARALATTATSASLAAHEPKRLDQGQTGSCTAHGLAGAVFTAAAGLLAWVPSPDDEYKATRGLERAIPLPQGAMLPPLEDVGAELADAIDAMREVGISPMRAPAPDGRNSDVDPSTVNDELDIARLEVAATTVVTGEHVILDRGKALSDQVAAALAAGFPVYVGFFVDSAFEALKPGQVAGAPDESDPNGGGHAVYLSGFTTQADGSRVFTLTNSWGNDWCDDGRCLVGEAWLAAAWEFWIVDVTITKGGAS